MKHELSKRAFFLLAFAALLFTACENPGGGGGFTPQTNDSTANDAATLGFVGTSAVSSDTGVVTVKITEDDKIAITSVSEGTATIRVSADGYTDATITVTVGADGVVTIGTISKGILFTPQTNSSTANDAATLGLVGAGVSSSNTGVATVKIEDGNIVITSAGAGAAVITVSADGYTPAAIPVTVGADGAITIGTISKGGVVGGGGFTPQTNTSTANDAATLGFVGTSVASSDTGVVAVEITEDDKIAITSVGAGNATITVSADGMPATIPVTVADNGGITIGTITKGVSYTLIPIPGGSFQRDGTATNISVITTDYRMGETEVTQELFLAVMGMNPSYYHGGSGREPADGETQNKRPVERVSWYDAIAFCNKLSLANGKEPVYSVSGVDWATLAYDEIPTSSDAAWNDATWNKTKNGYRLPTEMEWMWAAMGANKTARPNTTGYSKTFAGSDGINSIGDYAWYPGNATGKTHEAGKKSANEIGLKDMSGNVWEWCWDRWGSSIPDGTQTDYDGASDADRVIRGGSWYDDESCCAVSFRYIYYPYLRYDGLGFRVACP